MELEEIRKHWKILTDGKDWKTGEHDIQYKIVGNTLYFAGSNSLQDYIHSLYICDEYRLMRLCVSTFRKIITSPEFVNVDTVVGYSFGGAIAQYFAFIFSVVLYKVITYGCIKIRYGVSEAINIRYGSDIVTKLPPWGRNIGKTLDFGDKNILNCIKDHIGYGKI